MAEQWTVDSWRVREAAQQPEYPEPRALARAVEQLRGLPPLVSPGEIDRLRSGLADAAAGRRFVLHGGDCAETFADCTADALRSKLQVLLQMSLVLTYATRKPVLRIGRIAGQYAKPRSKPTEQVGDEILPTYRGDLVNGQAPELQVRHADPARLLEGYHHAAASLNYLRALIEGGFADLHYPERWDLDFIEQSPRREAYRRAVDAILDSVAFMDTVGASSSEALRRIELYTSHEALVLPYEEAMTREVTDNGHLNLGAHMLWVGYRTAALDGAHVEYLRGIGNPVGVKVGPKQDPHELVQLLDRLDPERSPGRITLITRFGATQVAELLPRVLRAVQRTGHPVLWSCDPMHGNTEQVHGLKTRRVESIFSELEQTFRLHQEHGSFLGGVHFEMTGEDVTECIGGTVDVREADLHKVYATACDPRLNGSQALELAFRIAETLR